MIEVRYIYSACVTLKTPDTKILCDPWFSDGVYDGSWYQFPKLTDPLTTIGKTNYIYISHIHPDHYDPVFLRQYLAKYPTAKIIIGKFLPNFLEKKMLADGFNPTVIDELNVGETGLKIVLNDQSNPNDVDSALSVKYREHSVINMNDNLYQQEQIDALLKFSGKPSIALLGYTGAGPYPQTYYTDEKILTEKAKKKKEAFFARYKKMQSALKPKVTIPFAGKYILGGKRHLLNQFRGVADPIEITKFDNTAVVLADGGNATINTQDLKPSKVRTEAYNETEIKQYAKTLAENPMTYEGYLSNIPISALPIKRLLPKAYYNALKQSQCKESFYFCIRLQSEWAVMNANPTEPLFNYQKNINDLSPRSEITIDLHYLFGLITCIFHWNNAEIGSQYFVKRTPNIFNRQAQAFLNFFHV